MKTNKGYPIKPDALRSPKEIEERIFNVQNNRTAYLEYEYAPKDQSASYKRQEIGGLYQELHTTKRVLDKLDDVVISPEKISMRAELILVCEKYKKDMDTYDLEGCLSTVYGREIHLGCSLNEDDLSPHNYEDARLQVNFLDWYQIK